MKLAKLSRLKLSETEIKKYEKELSSILDYVERLESVDVSGLEPTYQVTGLVNQTRKDVLEKAQPTTPEALLKCAPRMQNKYIKVGRMI